MAIVCAAYATKRINSLRNGMHKLSKFGTYRACATRDYSAAMGSERPATTRFYSRPP